MPVSSAELRYETRQARFAEVPGPPARLEVEPRDVALPQMSQRRTLLACAAAMNRSASSCKRKPSFISFSVACSTAFTYPS